MTVPRARLLDIDNISIANTMTICHYAIAQLLQTDRLPV